MGAGAGCLGVSAERGRVRSGEYRVGGSSGAGASSRRGRVKGDGDGDGEPELQPGLRPEL